MLGDSINIFNFNCNPVVLKKIDKTCKKSFLVQLTQERGQYGSRPKQKTIFFAEITKADQKLSKTFYTINQNIIYVLAEL